MKKRKQAPTAAEDPTAAASKRTKEGPICLQLVNSAKQSSTLSSPWSILSRRTTHYEMDLEKRNRLAIRKPSTPVDHKSLVQHAVLRLPLRFLPEYWQRHQLSLEDRITMIKHSRSPLVWHVALMEGIPISNTATKHGHTEHDDITFAARATAVQKLIELYEQRHRECKSWPNRLRWPREVLYPSRSYKTKSSADKSVLPLPLHFVTRDDFLDLVNAKNGSVLQSQQFPDQKWLGRPVLKFSYVWSWRSIYLVPIKLVTDTTLMVVRVLPFQEYLDIYGSPLVLAHCPDIVMIQEYWWCTTDEQFYLTVIETPKK